MRLADRQEVEQVLRQLRALFAAAIGSGNPSDQAQAVDVAGTVLVWLFTKFPQSFPDQWIQQLSRYLKETDDTLSSLRERFDYLRCLFDRILRQVVG